MKKEIIEQTKVVIIEILNQIIEEIGYENFKQHIIDNLIEVNEDDKDYIMVETEFKNTYDYMNMESGILTFVFMSDLKCVYKTYIEISNVVKDYIRDYIENESDEQELKNEIIEMFDDEEQQNIELIKSNSLMDILLM